MRDTKFRGKRLDNGEWAYGSLLLDGDNGLAWIVSGAYNSLYPKTDEQNVFRVDPETVGQYTGLLDKNGREIYEGDIISCIDGILVVEYESKHSIDGVTYSGFVFRSPKYGRWAGVGDIEVIGNIHENPELLKPKGSEE